MLRQVELCSQLSSLRSPLVLVDREPMRLNMSLVFRTYSRRRHGRQLHPKRVLKLKTQQITTKQAYYYGNATAAARSSAPRASATTSGASGARASRTAPSSGHSSQVKSESAAASNSSQTKAAPLLEPF